MIQDIIIENTEMVPGADLHPFGVVTFATTIDGDAYCSDTNVAAGSEDAPIVIMTHEVIFEGLPREMIVGVRKRAAAGFGDFLSQFLAEALETEPLYPPRD